MGRKRSSYYRNNNKSGLYFILFIVAAGLIFVWYFADWNGETETENSNQQQTESEESEQNKEKNKETEKKVVKDDNKNENENVNSEVGGESMEVEEQDLGLTVIGYGELKKTSQEEMANVDLGDGNSISVMPLEYENMVINSISATKEEIIQVQGQEGVKLTGGSAKDGSEVSFVLVKVDDNLYQFRGNDSFLDNLDNFVKFE